MSQALCPNCHTGMERKWVVYRRIGQSKTLWNCLACDNVFLLPATMADVEWEQDRKIEWTKKQARNRDKTPRAA